MLNYRQICTYIDGIVYVLSFVSLTTKLMKMYNVEAQCFASNQILLPKEEKFDQSVLDQATEEDLFRAYVVFVINALLQEAIVWCF